MQRGDLLAGDRPREVGAVAVRPGAGHHQAGALGERPEQLPDRNVEARGRLLQHPVAGRQAVTLLHPEQPVDDAAVGVHRPLRPARGAGGEDHVGEVVGAGNAGKVGRAGAGLRAVCAPRPAPGRRGIVEADGCRTGPPAARRQPQPPGRRALRQHDRRSRVGEDLALALGRIVGIERQVGAAGLEDGEQADSQSGGALGGDGDQRFRSDAERAQPACQQVGAGVQLGEGEALAGGAAAAAAVSVLHDRHRRRRAAHLALDELVEAERGPVRDRGVVPLAQLLALLRGEEREHRDGRRRVVAAALGAGECAGEQCAQPAEQALGGGGVEQVAVVLQRAGQVAVDLGRQQREVDLGCAPRQPYRLERQAAEIEARPRHAERKAAEAAASRTALAVEHAHGLEDRRAAGVAALAELLGQQREWIGVMGEGRDGGLPHLAQQLAEGGVSRQVAADDDRIGQVPDQTGEIRVVASGDRHADAQLGLAARPV